jgi:hypothetical protein
MKNGNEPVWWISLCTFIYSYIYNIHMYTSMPTSYTYVCVYNINFNNTVLLRMSYEMGYTRTLRIRKRGKYIICRNNNIVVCLRLVWWGLIVITRENKIFRVKLVSAVPTVMRFLWNWYRYSVVYTQYVMVTHYFKSYS